MSSKQSLLFAAALSLSVALLTPVAHAQKSAETPVLSATSIGAVGIHERIEEMMARQMAKDALGRRPLRDAEEKEEHERGRVKRDRHGLPQNPLSPLGAATGADLREVSPLARIAQPLAPQTVGTSFTAATLSGVNPTLSFPPDNMGAVGPTQFFTFVNGRLVTFNKTTGVADGVLNANPDVFFNSIINGSSTSDPRVRYDRLSGRWILLIINVSTPNRILIAVSDAASAGVISGSTVFTYFFVDIATTAPAISSTCFADYPTLGIDANALYVGTNNFCGSPTQTFNSTDGYVIRKTSILGAGPIVVTVFRGLVPTSAAAGPYTPQGVDNFDPAATEGYFIGVDNAAFGLLQFRRVTNPGGTPAISANIPITVTATAYPINVNHLGNTGATNGQLSSLDDRLFAATIRGGRLWTAHNIGVTNTGVSSGSSTRNGSRWYELNVPVGGTPTIVQSGTVFTANASNTTDQRSYWVPTIMVSGQGHAAMSFSAAGTLDRANSATVGRLSGDAPGTMQAPVLITASATAYNPPSDPGGGGGRRWGDYTYTSVDPNDDMTMWSVSQFCNATNSYGVRVTKLIAPPPAAPTTLADVNAGSSSVSVTLTGVSAAGSGFFDPGANLPGVPAFTHLTASITNGAATGTPPTVVSATYVNPTTVTLVLNAASATANVGAEKYTLTIANPDGQVASAAIVHVVGGTPVATIGNVAGAETNAGTTTLSFPVTLTQSSASAVTINYATSNGTATTADGDYVAATSSINIPSGQTSGNIVITVNGDTKFEANETFTVTLTGATNATLGATVAGTGTINNDDVAPSVTVGNVSVTEGNAGTTNASFTVTLSAASGLASSVGYATSDGSATTGDGDYTALTGTLNLAPGVTTGTVDVTVNGDTKYEGNETFSLVLSTPSGATLGLASFADGTINNDDAAPLMNISGFAVAEGNSGTTNGTFAVVLSAPSGLPVTVDWATADSTATVANPDYTAGSGTLTFAPGEVLKQGTVLINGDVVLESNEFLLVKISNASGAAINSPQAVCAIFNDDSGPVLTADAASIAEGNSGTSTLTFNVALSNGTDQAVSVDWATSDGTAIAGSDYMAASGTLTIPAKSTAGTIGVTVNGDLCGEADETFTLTLSNPVNTTLAGASVIGTITNDDDTTAPSVTVSMPNGGEVLQTGGNAFLQWTATDNGAVASVKIELSRDGGATYPEVIATGLPNTGSYSWTVISPVTTGAFIRVTATDDACNDGSDVSDAAFEIADPVTGVPHDAVTAFGLGPVMPNPSHGSVQFDYMLPRESHVRVSILDVQGREVALIASGAQPAGRHTAQWSGVRPGGAVSRGLYFVRYEAGGKVFSKRFAIVR